MIYMCVSTGFTNIKGSCRFGEAVSFGEEPHSITLLGSRLGLGRSWAPSREHPLFQPQLFWRLRTGNNLKTGVLI